MVICKNRCCAKTLKGTRCKLSNAFNGEFCHIHAPKVDTEAPVAEVEPKEPETKQASTIMVHPTMDDDLWSLIIESVGVSGDKFKETLEWAAFEGFSDISESKFEFLFDRSFPDRLINKMFTFSGEDLKVSYTNFGILKVEAIFR